MLASRTIKSTLKYSIKSLGSNSKGGGADASLAKAPPKALSPLRHDWRFAWQRFKTETKLKFRQNKTPVIVCLVFWLSGFCYYEYYEPASPNVYRRFLQVLLVSLAIRSPSPESVSDFSKFYELCWPIFLEVVVFGLVATSMMAHYNPVVVCQMSAEGLQDHSVVVGCEHLGDKIVDHLRMNAVNYCVVEESVEKVASLIKVWEPVVVGNPTDLSTLKSARVQNCKEVFVVLNSLHTAILVCFQIRSLNKNCALYVQVYEHGEFREYFAQEPLRAFTFSTSNWAVSSVMEWIKEDSPVAKPVRKTTPYPLKKQFSVILPPNFRYSLTDAFKKKIKPLSSDQSSSSLSSSVSSAVSSALYASTSSTLTTSSSSSAALNPSPKDIVVIGSSNLAKRIVTAIAEEGAREAHWAEFGIEGVFNELDGIKGKVNMLALTQQKLLNLENHLPFESVSHVFLCWNRESHFSDIVFLLMMLSTKFPHIRSYVQIPDETLANIIGSLNAIPFSTSSYAFKMLQKEVPESSGLRCYLEENEDVEGNKAKSE